MRLGLLLAVLLFQASDRLRWVPNPRTSTGSWVADPANHLRPATVAAIDSIISALERESSAEIAVVVLDSLDGLEPGEAALLLSRRWGVGKRERDNGIVFLWSPTLRRTHVSVGYGLEGVLIDSRVGRIQDEFVIPAFRRGDFDAGMLAGVQALAAAAREEKYSGLARVAAGRPGPEAEADRTTLPGWGYGIMTGIAALPGWGYGIVAGIAALLAGLWLRRRVPRRCSRGHGWMRRLGEIEDDAFLGKQSQLEETLGSMDYDVWVCAECDERKVIPYKRFSLKYRKCPRCTRRTCESESTTLSAATYSSTGLRRVTRLCKNCGFTDTREETIPMLTRSSSGSSGGSGGGGGSSFGGGSSGGGGAGRSY